MHGVAMHITTHQRWSFVRVRPSFHVSCIAAPKRVQSGTIKARDGRFDAWQVLEVANQRYSDHSLRGPGRLWLIRCIVLVEFWRYPMPASPAQHYRDWYRWQSVWNFRWNRTPEE